MSPAVTTRCCGFPCCYFAPLWFVCSFDWVAAGESHLILRAGGNLILEIKKESEARRKKRPCPSSRGESEPSWGSDQGLQTRGSPPRRQSTHCRFPPRLSPAGLCGLVLPQALCPSAGGETADPWGGLGFPRPHSAAPSEHILPSLQDQGL